MTDQAELLALFSDPASAGRRALEIRAAGFGKRIWIRPAPAHAPPRVAAVLRGDELLDLSPALADMSLAPAAPVPADMSLSPAAAVPADRSITPAAPVPADMSLSPSAPVSADMSLAPAAPVPADAPAWPDLTDLQPGDRLLVHVAHDQLPAYCAWLARVCARPVPADLSLTPFCASPGGLFRLHLIAAARVALGPRARVEVRHDLHGVRLAQVALGFGADTLAGPIDAGRHLPLAGVPRPSETSEAALCELVRQAGLEPSTRDPRTDPRNPS